MMVGLISQTCSVKNIALKAIEDAKYMCDRVCAIARTASPTFTITIAAATALVCMPIHILC